MVICPKKEADRKTRKAERAMFKKRSATVKRKAQELSSLCNCEVTISIIHQGQYSTWRSQVLDKQTIDEQVGRLIPCKCNADSKGA